MSRRGLVGLFVLVLGCGDGVASFDIGEDEREQADIIGTVFVSYAKAGTIFVNRPNGTIYEVWTVGTPEFESERLEIAVPNHGTVTYTDGDRYFSYFDVLPRDRLVFSAFASESSGAMVVTEAIPSPNVPKDVHYYFWGCDSQVGGPTRRQFLVLRGDCGRIGETYDLMSFATTPEGEPLAYAMREVESGREVRVESDDWRSEFAALPLRRESLPTSAGRTASVLMRTGETYFRTPGEELNQDSRMLLYPPIGQEYAVSYQRQDPIAGDRTIVGLGNDEEPFALERPKALIVDLESGRVHWQPGSGSDGHVLRFAWNEAGRNRPVEWYLAGPATVSDFVLPFFYKERRPMPSSGGGFVFGEVGSVEFSDYRGYEEMIFAERSDLLFRAFDARMGRDIRHYQSGGTARLATRQAMYR